MKNKELSKRVLVIGLDAADVRLLKTWSDDGSLPVMESLMKKGLWGDLNTITEISHMAVWPSIFTGTNPGKHGIYNIFQASPCGYEINRVNAKQCAQPPIWKYLDDSGRRCIVIDAPFDCTIDGFHGIQIREWGSWVRYTEQGSNPEAIWDKLVAKFGIPPIEHEATAQWSKIEELTRLRNWLIEGVKKKEEAVKWLMKTQEWELFVAVFPETHPAGHFFWHLNDMHYDAYSGRLKKELGNYLKDIYQRVDAAIGQIIAQLNENDILLIVSGDRIGPNYSGWHLLPETLSRLGLMASKGDNFQIGSGGGVTNRNGLLKRIRDKVPEGLRKRISGVLPETLRFRMWKQWTGISLDWPNTKVFYVPNDCQGHIRINMKGREPSGSVEPGREYDKLCASIKEQLEELINPYNGKKAVKAVIRTDQIFSGELTHQLPDLVVIWNEDAKLTNKLFSERIGSVKSQFPAYALPPYYVGNHRSPGFALLKGPGIKTGKLKEDSHIYDMAPTILSFFQCSIPTPMEGKIWEDILENVKIKEKCFDDY